MAPRAAAAALLRWSLPRYLLTGGALFLLDLAVFLGLRALGLGIPAAQLCSRATGAVAGFFGHRHFSFARGGDGRVVHQLGPYAALTAFNLLLSPWLVLGAVGLAGGDVRGKLLAEVGLVLGNWLILRLVFRSRAAA